MIRLLHIFVGLEVQVAEMEKIDEIKKRTTETEELQTGAGKIVLIERNAVQNLDVNIHQRNILQMKVIEMQ